ILAASVAALAGKPPPGGGNTITVSGTQWGTSTAYIGATEGNVRFNITDFTDCGINTYRIYGGMSRWEAQDDDGVYGSPSIAEIKANPGVINWAWWDNIMTNPPDGSDYWWSGTPGTTWQGNARTIFTELKNAGVKVVLTIRNVDNNKRPTWAPNPPTTAADWNEWWEHVFATVYWLNVRNDYRVDDFQVHNEPNNSGQGFAGNEADYFELVKSTKDAIDYVYRTYLPGRTYHIYAPVTTGGSSWPLDCMQNVPGYFDTVDIHSYSGDVSGYVQQTHAWMNANGYADAPVCLSEWCTYRGSYTGVSFCIGTLINNLIRCARPGNDHVDLSHLFTFYDWDGFSGGFQNFTGLINKDGARIAGYYALRIGCRALQGGRATYETTCNNSNMLAITTRDAQGKVYLLATNTGSGTLTVDANLSALISSGTGTMWQFAAGYNDVVVGNPTLSGGRVTFNIPGNAAVLLKF
ncbi:MAG: hypothetical protein ACM3X6_01335, partial [Patescibacteria group bacterium]